MAGPTPRPRSDPAPGKPPRTRPLGPCRPRGPCRACIGASGRRLHTKCVGAKRKVSDVGVSRRGGRPVPVLRSRRRAAAFERWRRTGTSRGRARARAGDRHGGGGLALGVRRTFTGRVSRRGPLTWLRIRRRVCRRGRRAPGFMVAEDKAHLDARRTREVPVMGCPGKKKKYRCRRRPSLHNPNPVTAPARIL